MVTKMIKFVLLVASFTEGVIFTVYASKAHLFYLFLTTIFTVKIMDGGLIWFHILELELGEDGFGIFELRYFRFL